MDAQVHLFSKNVPLLRQRTGFAKEILFSRTGGTGGSGRIQGSVGAQPRSAAPADASPTGKGRGISLSFRLIAPRGGNVFGVGAEHDARGRVCAKYSAYSDAGPTTTAKRAMFHGLS